MTRFSLIVLTLTASPALAHPGAHIHPHDSAGWLGLALGACIIAGASVMAWRK